MNLNKNKNILGLLAVMLLTNGCATITKDANQNVQIDTYSKDNQPISGVRCTAKNERGEWTITAPGIVSVHRSGNNLLLNCKKEGNEPGSGTVISRVNGGMFGNIVFGGGIGAIIDHNKGTAYTYPSWVRIVMGDNLIYDRRDEKDSAPLIGKSPESVDPSTENIAASGETK